LGKKDFEEGGQMSWKDSIFIALFITFVSMVGHYLAECLDHIVRMIFE